MPDHRSGPLSAGTHSLLRRHQIRREQGVPTLCLLLGSPEIAAQVWLDWAQGAGRRASVSSARNEVDLAGDWLDAVAAGNDLVEAALLRIAARHPVLRSLNRGRLERMTLAEFEALWESLHFSSVDNQSSFVAHEILTSSLEGTDSSPRLRDRIISAAPMDRAPLLANVLIGFTGVLPANRLPANLLIPPESHPSADLLAAAKMLAALVTAAPALPIGMQASASAIESLMQSSADSRLATLLREGAVNLETGDSDQLPSDPAEKGNAIPVATLAYLTRIGAAAEVKELLAETARHLVKPTKEEEDRARSAAEQFLFRVLELLPATAGRFKLNERLEFQHGPRSAEGDLVAAAERVAIELDGHYYHLADAEAYRRDRKKDYSYQRHGYLILRFLSEDVVARLEEIVKRITEAIEDNEG
jgi:Protein of unknown function (DUF559)